MADILSSIAQGPTPVTPVNVLGNAAQVAGIQQQRAQTAATQAQLPLIAAQTQGAQEQAHGITLDNVLKQRNVNAQQALVGLLQKHTQKLPDGSTATDMGNVIGEYQALYPDKALELQQKSLEVENQRAVTARNQFELASAQQKHVGFSLGTAGFADPDSAAKDPQIVSKFNNAYQQAQKDGTAQLIGVTPQQFAQNPSAYIPKLANLVNQSGAKSDALKQGAEQVDLRVHQLGQVREQFAQGMQSVSTPQEYAKLYNSLAGSLDPHAFAAANLAPPSTVSTPQSIAAIKQAAALTQMSPADRLKLTEEIRHNTQTEISARLTASAEAAKANTAAGELGLKRFESSQAFGPGALAGGGGGGVAAPAPVPGGPGQPPATGGVPQAPTPSAPTGRVATSLTPPVNGPRATAQLAQAPVAQTAPAAPVQQAPTAPAPAAGKQFPIMTVDGKKLDLNGSTPTARAWQSAPPVVQGAALKLLTGDAGGGVGMAGIPGMAVQNQAAALALKINPHYVQQSEARKDAYGTSAQQQILSANTAISHSNNLLDAANKLGNTRFPSINKTKLIANAQTGKEEPTNFENIRDAYVRELGKYFAGGQLGEKEFDQAASRIAAANSPDQLRGAVKANNKLLLGGMTERESQYNDLNNGAIMGDRQRFLNADSRDTLKRQGLMHREEGDVIKLKSGESKKISKVYPNGRFDVE